ncbi:hypothetical protein TI04_06150 [Achromatium sp. WMS2]|nr:hypothetical protein TI04_06150 [Achromatium sp. WMS2]
MFEIFSTAFNAAIVITIPFIVSHIGNMLLYKVVQQEFFQVPILRTLAHTQGILAGLLLMRLQLDSSYFNLERIFLVNGPWNITLYEFLMDRANVFVYDSFSVLRLLGDVPSNEGLLAVLIVVILPLLLVVFSMRFWERSDAVRALLASAGIALWTGWFTVYLVCTVFWTLYSLNFWILGLAVLYIQYRKSLGGGGHH